MGQPEGGGRALPLGASWRSFSRQTPQGFVSQGDRRPQRGGLKETVCEMSLEHSGRSINISFLSKLLEPRLFSVLEAYYPLSLTPFS